jgi:O-methyltransferase involved in polyketide biosynthesis
MAAAAREATRDLSNVEILEGDVRTAIPARDYQFAFLGGLCMYINDDDVVALLQSLKKRLGSGCSVVLRESTVPGMRDARSGRYQVVYRNVADYRNLFKRAGFASTEVRRNYGYTSMEIAIELVASRRKWVSILPKQSPALGALTWWSLRLTSPLSLWALPRLLSRAGIAWPSLQNHFFRLTT